MSLTLVADPAATPLTLSDYANGWRLTRFSAPPPEPDSQWASSADTEGERRANLRYRNRTITATVLVQKATVVLLEAQENLLGAKVGKLARDGGELRLGYPSGETITFDVEEATFSRTFDPAHVVNHLAEYELTFTCKPFGRGAQVTGDVEAGSTPVLDFTVLGIPGDVAPLIDLVITDTATQDRRFVEWGAGPDVTNPVIVDSDSLVTTGFGGVQTTRTGAYDPNATGNNVVSTTVGATVAMCGTGQQSHVGTFRIRARVYAEESDTYVRLVWQDKDGPFSPNPWVLIPQADQWRDVDLGIVALKESDLGDQEWSGRVEGKRPGAEGVLAIDFLALFPGDYGYGVARAVSPDVAGVISAGDSFTGTTAGGNLNARTPPTGAAWATSGATTDFQFIDAADTTSNASEAVSRSSSSASFRYGVLGSAMTDQQAQVSLGPDLGALGQGTGECGLILRWTDASNYLRFTLTVAVSAVGQVTADVALTKVVAGSATVLATGSAAHISGSYLTLRCTAGSSGLVLADVLSSAGAGGLTLNVNDSAVATGGTLASGRAGIIDSGDGSTTPERWYDNVLVYTPAPEDITLYSGQDFQIRPGVVERASSDGTKYGRPSERLGFTIKPNPGDMRVAVRANRADLTTTAYGTVDDSLQAQVFYTPRYLVVPEA